MTTTGLGYFVPIHTRSTVAKEPCPDVYRRFRDARKVTPHFGITGDTMVGKGIISKAGRIRGIDEAFTVSFSAPVV